MKTNRNSFRLGLWAAILIGGSLFAGTPSVIEDARFKGDFGARFPVGQTPDPLVDGSPEGETAYRARFYISVNDLDLGSGNELVIFAGRDATQESQVELVLRGAAGGAVDAFLRVRLDSNTLTASPSGRLIRGWQALEVRWTAGDGTGAATLLRDGVAFGSVIDLDNDQSVIDDVTLGVIAETGAGNSGSFDIDDFSSRKVSNPGLVCLNNQEFLGFLADWPARDLLEEMDLLNRTCAVENPSP